MNIDRIHGVADWAECAAGRLLVARTLAEGRPSSPDVQARLAEISSLERALNDEVVRHAVEVRKLSLLIETVIRREVGGVDWLNRDERTLVQAAAERGKLYSVEPDVRELD